VFDRVGRVDPVTRGLEIAVDYLGIQFDVRIALVCADQCFATVFISIRCNYFPVCIQWKRCLEVSICDASLILSKTSIFITVFNLLVLYQLHRLDFTNLSVFCVDHLELNFGLAAVIVNGTELCWCVIKKLLTHTWWIETNQSVIFIVASVSKKC